ncbi:exportin-T [Cucumis melo var. makuwa]|uniref:Exportin-T n=2 Tax=Cucumis melo TaxID=3656 RepID=A0A1S3CI57_CUCME|nr:exportin-T [Cucumis melo]XP_008462298.1 exportin-T [Cucumis melo]XP_008462299.1 exportin-T [Cucumis melo]XP_050947649.1 exportin-T [Cucumis melo]KAA0059396.1 exportin-T [Cucumis melo var. makuwa]TYK03931.1 exportin-T [Cucumis melo var. makuwa]
MDDLEKAIVIMFDETSNVDSNLKLKANEYCDKAKDESAICRVCVEKLCFSNIVQVQFWCLQTLHETIRIRYSWMSLDEKYFIRKSVFSIVCLEGIDENHALRILRGPAFIKNKLAQVLVSLIYLDYPMNWPSVFVDFLSHLRKGPVVIDMFCRVLNTLDDESISMDYPRTPEEVTAAGRIKDAMRAQCVSSLVGAWYDILSMYKNSDQELCASVLDAMRRYISWIDIGLIVNDVILPLLFELTLVDGLLEQLRGAAAGCLLAVVSKRMDHQAKLTLLQSLQISRVFGLVATEDSDSELVSKVASLLTGYAVEVLECFKRLNSEESKSTSLELLNEVLPSVFYVLQKCELDSAFSIVQFLSGYVATMKSLSPLTEKQLLHLSQILEVILAQICYDPVYRHNLDILDKIGQEEEDRMVEFRKDLLVLLRSVGRVAPDVTQLFIRSSMVSAASSSSDRNVEEVEASLTLFFAYGESLSDEVMKNGSGLVGELVTMLLSTRFSCHSNRLVALIYLETIFRYIKVVQENSQFIHVVLAAFLDERGIHHPNINVSRRASYLFMRVVKLLKVKLIPYIETILTSLQDTVARFTSSNFASNELSGSEDGSHIFEAIGLLIGMEDVPLEKQSDYLSSLLKPLCQQVEVVLINAKALTPEEATAKIATIQQIIMAINALSKGFNERLVTTSRPAIGLMFKQTLDVLLQVLIAFPKVEPLRTKVLSFIHRMVETLGASVFPYLPKALEQLLAESEPKELVGFLVLLNQLICKFSTSVHGILEDVFPTIASRIFNVIPRDSLPSGPGTNIEEIRELQELQRIVYTFLHVITTHDLSSVFLSPKSRSFLEPMMQLLLNTSCNHKDILVRKACVQIFIKLIKDWCVWPSGEEKVPGFQSFIIEGFAKNCCLYSVLDKSFELHDANSLILLGEIVAAQKVMYEKFGQDFLFHFVSKGFLTAHCPQDLAEQYCQKLQGSDIKALKSFYQSLIESLRVQQNGSLVFR